jgi:acetylornithine deacetylase/succinyl-diaminopimelate desuccinylase-like protein
MPTVDPVLAHVDAHIDESLQRLMALVRIPSISTDPAYAEKCRQAGQWLTDDLSAQGYEASLRDTAGHPMVVAHDRAATAGPHVLFYGHYDVQPVDPLNLWHTDPFEPTIKEGPDGEKQLVGRGTSDDKGQLLTFVEACRAWKVVHGTLPIRVTFLFEGEEESGSPSLVPFLEKAGDELRADLALVCDTDMWGPDTPSINSMLRGLVGEEITITCADKDLHSGMFGSAARNPNQVLAEIIASLRKPDGSVAIEGFYDDVAEVPASVAEQWRNLGFDQSRYLGSVGLTTPAGEMGRDLLEQIWSRPTCEINGIWGGYTGDGFKTVIPSKASAKISFRLVSAQDPKKIREAFRAHVRARLPADCTVSFSEHGGSPAITVPVDGPYLAPALAALTAEWNKQAVVVGSGGSIPVVGEFKRRLGMDTLLVGYAQIDDRIHSPNEKYNLKSFHKGIRSWVRIIAALAEVK